MERNSDNGDDDVEVVQTRSPWQRFVNAMRTQGTITGRLEDLPYAEFTTCSARYTITRESVIGNAAGDATLVFKISLILDPAAPGIGAGEEEHIFVYGSETELKSFGNYSTHEPSEIGQRAVAVIQNAAGLA